MQKEMVVLVNHKGEPVGTVEKLTGHHAQTPLHLAFSCYVFNDEGQFLVTRRASSKKVWPGVWSNSVCGHPAPRPASHTSPSIGKANSSAGVAQNSWEVEPMVDAIKRRLNFELGMTARDFANLVPDYVYRTPPFNGIIEHEFCPIYIARAASEPQPNPEEVADYKWLPWKEYIAVAESDPADIYSWWCKDQLKQIKTHPLIQTYSQTKLV